ncbi:MAG: DUF4878 domain-containing protein [Candidatus Dadabacteria bacterium]|nr:MAG: DUF4878 domain-containing protein [Candidatus Dadabacteria bacterium]
MKKIIMALGLIVSMLFYSGTLLAEKSPSDTFKEMVARVKKEGRPSVMLDYVHWDSAFKELSAQEKQQLGVNNSKEFKAYLSGIFDNPRKFVTERMGSYLNQMPPEQREAMVNQMVAGMEKESAKMKKEMMESTFKILDEKTDGDRATLTVQTKSADKTETEKIHMVQVGGKWYLSSGTFAGGSKNSQN